MTLGKPRESEYQFGANLMRKITMSKLTAEQRSALQSARAKNRKASVTLGNAATALELVIPKHIVSKMRSLEEWYAATLAPRKTTDSQPEVKVAVAA